MKSIHYILIFFSCIFCFGQNNATRFKQANDLYNSGDYEQALSFYKKIYDAGEHSASLYFNMANAHYKLNNVAESIYNYERALALDPDNEDIKTNLSFAQKMTIDAINTIPESGFSKVFNAIIGKFDFDTWATFAIISVILFVVAFLLYYFSYNTRKKRVLFLVSAFSLLFMLASLLFAFQQEAHQKTTVYAIVFSEESQVKTEPNPRSNESFRLHEGTKVKVLESINGWKKVKLADGKTGWISAKEIVEL